ncbi:MAG: cyclopropane-fatty-acyl-phospholipid synthase family protein [Sulfitobacter sp.]
MFFLTQRMKHDFLESCAQISSGRLRLQTPEGEIYDFGQGAPAADMQIFDWSVVSAIASRADIGLGETYVEGLWTTSSIQDLTCLILKNQTELDTYLYSSFWNTLKFRIIDRLMRANSQRGSARNIRSHYDIGNEFYQLWLDDSMTYSSGLFTAQDNDLGRAQARKYDRILDRIGDAQSVLEIGCGWGGFAERAADAGRHVTGITISPSQKGYADARLDGRADILLQDYRKTSGTFDSVVSIEMIEAVGERYWPTYFATIKARLSQTGTAVIQAITVPDEEFARYRRNSDYIRQYTFPGGMLLSDEVIADQAKQAGLQVTNSYAFGRDYAQTCAMWDARLTEQEARIKKLGYDDAFLRNWHFYLSICAASFAVKQTNVVQVELKHA